MQLEWEQVIQWDNIVLLVFEQKVQTISVLAFWDTYFMLLYTAKSFFFFRGEGALFLQL